MGKRKPRLTKHKPEAIKSITRLAQAVGRSRGTVASWLARSNWPVGRAGPWSVADAQAVREWANGRQVARHAGTDAERAARLAVLRERAATLRQRRLIERGEFYSREEVDAGRVQRIHEIKRGLLRLSREVAESLKLDAAGRAVIDKRVNELLRAYSGQEPEWLKGTCDENESTGKDARACTTCSCGACGTVAAPAGRSETDAGSVSE